MGGENSSVPFFFKELGRTAAGEYLRIGCNNVTKLYLEFSLPGIRQMNPNDFFNTGTTDGIDPEGDAARQAVDSLRGYAYQVLAATLAWIDIDEKSRLFLEVAEDYAIIAGKALHAVQVKDTEGSGSVTLNNENIRKAVAAFVDLVERNPGSQVELRYFTTSKIGTEQAIGDRPAGMAGLEYWRKVATGADISPLRTVLESDKFPAPVREFSKAREDAALRHDLIRRIHWDCGKPDIATLRQELGERLIVIGRDRYNLPALEAQRLADLLVYRVLQESIIAAPQERVLNRAELYRVIDGATRLSVPRGAVDLFSQLASKLMEQAYETQGLGKPLSADETSWIIDGTTLPAPKAMIHRVALESVTADTLGQFGACVLVGGSGLGKSNLSRAVVRVRDKVFTVVDFRDTDTNESHRRLNAIFARIGGLPSTAIILEDLNRLDDDRIALSLGRVIEALRRRDRVALITCYRKPSSKVLTTAGLDQRCVIECPYFQEEETLELVRINGGDPTRWGKLAHIAGSGGHPQLTHAFVIGIALRGWPIEEIGRIVGHGFSTEDTDAAREAARRELVAGLPEGTRNILYRLSLMASGRFNRALALSMGELSPPIQQAGECMDQLIGPWIEVVGKNMYRVSPLASKFGREMLAPDEQTRIHVAISAQMLSKRKIDAGDADAILLHALLGKSSQSLAVLAHSVLRADTRTREMLTEHFTLFSFLQTESAIFPENPSISAMLRLAQFRLAVAGKRENVSDIATALFAEASVLPDGELGRVFESGAIATVLGTMGIANHLDNWIDILRRFKVMVEGDAFLQHLRANIESAETDGVNMFSMLFGIGSADLSSVERLEHVIGELDNVDASERALWLTPIEKSLSDYSVFINSPWVSQQRENTLDAAEAALRYRRMAEKTQKWGIRPLTIQCWAAQAVMLDEYENDEQGALAVIDEAVMTIGDDPILARSRAKVYRHYGQHAMALDILSGIADQIGGDNSIDRAFALREAAISAAKCHEWSQAEKWFLEAQNAAKLAKLEDMRVMAIGLGADAAVAAFETGKVEQALIALAGAVEALADINPDASLRAAYCHRVVRHIILWFQSRVQESDVRIEGEPIMVAAGACSNPDPLPAIRDLPLGDIDLAWYMLAETETTADLDVGISAQLSDRLTEGPIPSMEFSLRWQKIQMAIDSLDARRFSTHFLAHIEAATYMLKRDRLLSRFDPLAPERGEIPAVDKNDPVAKQAATEAILAFGIRAGLAGQPDAMLELKDALDDEFAGDLPGKVVFDHLEGNQTASLTLLDQTVIYMIKILLRKDYVTPSKFWVAGLRLFEKINQSPFRHLLTPYLADWQRAGWKRITISEKFQLARPLQTIPVIEDVLAMPANNYSFVAKLLLVTAEAVSASLASGYRDTLRAMAEEAGP